MSSPCRICHKKVGRLITPCACRGSISCAHPDCIKQWIVRTRSHSCAVCGESFVVARVLNQHAPPLVALGAAEDADGTLAAGSAPLTESLRVIAKHLLKSWSGYAARATFVTVVWVIMMPLFLSLIWQLLFNTRWLANEINRSLLMPIGPTTADAVPFTWWWHWYVPGLELFVFGAACVVVVASFWEWCNDAIATFEDPTNFDVNTERDMAAAMAMANEDDEDDDADDTPDTGRDVEENQPVQEVVIVPPPGAAEAHVAQPRTPPPATQAKLDNVAKADVSDTQAPPPHAAPLSDHSPSRREIHAREEHSPAEEEAAAPLGMTPNELRRALSTLFDDGRQGGGDSGILEHFGARGSIINAIAIALAFGILFVPTMLFMLGASPFLLGSQSGLAAAGLWDAGAAMLPMDASSKDAVTAPLGVVLQALTGLPLATMLPTFHVEHAGAASLPAGTVPRFGLWHPGAVLFAAAGSYGGLGFVTWAAGALVLGGVLRHCSRKLFRSGAARKNGAFSAALIRSLVINLSQMVFLPAIFGLMLCVVTADYWTPQPTGQWRGDVGDVVHTAIKHLPIHTVVLQGNSASSANKQQPSVAQPTPALPLIKALSIVHSRLMHIARHPSEPLLPHDAELLQVVGTKLFQIDVGGLTCAAPAEGAESVSFEAARREMACFKVDERLVKLLLHKPSTLSCSLWTFRLYAVVAVLHNIHLYSDLGTWAPMFIAGMFSSTILWHCVYHIRRLVHHKWLSWLFRDPVETPMVQQMIRCRHRMVPIYCLRNLVLVLLSDVCVVLPALWLLRQLFPSSLPVLLSWSSGSSIIDAVGANVVVFGGRFARFMALLGGNVPLPLEEEVLFRRLAMIADFLRDAHEAFMERVGGDLRVGEHLQAGTAPQASRDFFFPFRVAMFVAIYIVVSVAAVSAVMIPGVAMNHWLLQMFPSDETMEIDLRSAPLHHLDNDISGSSAAAAPLTLHAVLIGWSMVLIGSQIYSVVAPHVRHAALTLRYRLLHMNRLRAIWAAVIVESATAGAIVLQHHSIKVALASEQQQQRDITALTAVAATVIGNPQNKEGSGVVQWLTRRDIVMERIAAAKALLIDEDHLAEGAAPVALLSDVLQLMGCIPSTTGRMVTKVLTLEEATQLRRALTDWRVMPVMEQAASAFVFLIVGAFGCALTPLLVGSTLLRLCWSGVVRSSTQTISLSGSLPTSTHGEPSTTIAIVNYLLTHTYPLWWVSWCVGALVLMALSVLWRQHFTRCARVLRDYQRVGLLQSGRLSCVGAIFVVVGGTILWMTAGISFFPVTVSRWSRSVFAFASGTPSPWAPDVEFLLSGYPEPSDAEMLLVHFGLLEWILVVTWNASIALVGDRHLPFLPSNREWTKRALIIQVDTSLSDSKKHPLFMPPSPTSPSTSNLDPDAVSPRREEGRVDSDHAARAEVAAAAAEAPDSDDDVEGVGGTNGAAVLLPPLFHGAIHVPRSPTTGWLRGVFQQLRTYVERRADQYCRDSYDAMYLKDIEVQNHVAGGARRRPPRHPYIDDDD